MDSQGLCTARTDGKTVGLDILPETAVGMVPLVGYARRHLGPFGSTRGRDTDGLEAGRGVRSAHLPGTGIGYAVRLAALNRVGDGAIRFDHLSVGRCQRPDTRDGSTEGIGRRDDYHVAGSRTEVTQRQAGVRRVYVLESELPDRGRVALGVAGNDDDAGPLLAHLDTFLQLLNLWRIFIDILNNIVTEDPGVVGYLC